MYLFDARLDGWAGWGKVFQNASVFDGLVQEALRRSGLPEESAQPLPPGTNAVFRAGDAVVKLFAPLESGIDSACDFECELQTLLCAQSKGIRCPRLLGHGCIEDRYRFFYIVTEYLPFPHAGRLLPGLSPAQRRIFAAHLYDDLSRLHHTQGGDALVWLASAKQNSRWDRMPPALRKQRILLLDALSSTVTARSCVLVHGDATGENVLAGQDSGGLFPILIDFADSGFAPPFYELPPVLFDLFRFDPVAGGTFLSLYAEDYGISTEIVIQELTAAFLAHDFSPDYLHAVALHASLPGNASLRAYTKAIRDYVTYALSI